jgi:hypothetical protein
VRGVLADHDCEGHLARLLAVARAAGWGEFWDGLGLVAETFAGVGLDRTSSDRDVWRTCQAEQLVLVTRNRNHDGPDSLEAVIRAEGTLDTLPVITLRADRAVFAERGYALRAAERMMEILVDMDDRYRGAGRLYIP